MADRTNRRTIWRLLPVLLLLLATIAIGSVAVAGVPAGNGLGAIPTNQDKGDGQTAQPPPPAKQPEDPRKGPEGPALPDTIHMNAQKGGGQAPQGGATATPTICPPGSGGGFVFFELEPNNTITTAQMLGGPKNNAEVRGQINVAGDVDYFSFTANAGDRIWAYAFTLGATSSTDSQLQLLNALSQTLQFDDDNGSQADLSSAIAGRVITTTGTYYLRINAFSAASTIAPYTLFIDRTSTAAIPEVEPNNSFTQTNPYVVGSVVTGTIATTADLDVYSFEFNDDDRYVFQVDGDPERDGVEFDPNFDLMNAAGAVLVTVDSDSQFDVREINSENAAFFIDTGGPPTSTLLLRVRTDNDGGGTATGSYNLHIWRVGEDFCGPTPSPTATATPTPVCNTFQPELEPNNTFTTAQVLPTLNNLEVRGFIQPAGDIDYYRGNTAVAGDKIWAYLFTGSSTSGADTELRMLNALSNTIQFDDDNGSQTAASSNISGAPITTTGAIYFRLNEFNNDGTVTPYLLFIDRTGSQPNVTEVEPNDVYTQANMVTVGDLITGTILATTDLDVYGFTATAGDRIIFQADGDPERDGVQYNPNFQILDSAGVQLVAVDSDSTLGDLRSEAHAFTFGAAGTYYVRMSSDVSGPTTGSYNLHLWRTAGPPCATNTPLPPTSTSTSLPATSTNTSLPPTNTRTNSPTNTAGLPTNTRTNTATNTAAVASATATICPPSVPFQEIEPNNPFTMANAIVVPYVVGAEVRGGITPAGDQDFFSFTATTGDRVWAYINTSNASPSTDSILTLLNSAGTVIQLDDDNGFQSTLSSAIAGGVITQTGTYYIGVRQFGGATIMSPYSLYINRSAPGTVPEVEPNDTLATANLYSFGSVVTGSIPISTDLDYYTFTLAQNDVVVIQVDGDPDRNGTNLSRVNQFNPNFDLLDTLGTQIVAVDSDSQGGNGGLLSEALVYTNTSAISTTFSVRIKFDPSTPVEDDLGIYNLHIYKVGGGQCPTTPTPSVAVPTSTNTVVLPTSTRTNTVGVGTSTATATACVGGQVILYDQLNSPGTFSTNSQDFETANNAFDNQTADDFIVPAGATWNVNQVDAQGLYFNGPGPAASFNVYFYTSVVSGTYFIPGAAVYTATGQSYINTAGVFAIT
ncbi:MAG: PPC domain-containing protein, partial [Chloroflexia bacterium]